MQQHDFQGVVLVARGADTLALQSSGAGASSRFALGSISKTFTAAAIELLASAGKLRYDDTVDKFVPEYRYAKQITIQQLLEHSAGVPDYYALPAFATVREKDFSLPQIVQWLNAFPLDFTPGKKSSYSNSGYTLLALIIERASGETYDTYLARHVFGPLHLRDTAARASPGDVPGYDPGPPPSYLQPAAPVGNGWLIGNGSIRSSAADLSQWLDTAAAGTLINPKSLPYPMGWSKAAGSTVLEQDGRIPGFASDISIDEKTGLKVIVLSNIQCAVVTKMARDIRNAYESNAGLSPVALRPTYATTPAQLNAVAGTYGFPGLNLVVAAQGDSLALTNANDGIQLPLDPVGPNQYFFRPLYVSIAFKTDAKGAPYIDWGGQFTLPKR